MTGIRRFNILIAELLSRWYHIAMLISLLVFILSIGAISLAVYDLVSVIIAIYYGIYYNTGCSFDPLLLIVSLLSDFLLAFVLVVLARKIYIVTRKAVMDPEKEFAEVDVTAIEKYFIGILVTTMFIIALRYLSTGQVSALYTGIAVSAITIAASIYLYLSNFVVSKEEKKTVKKEEEKEEGK